MRKEVLFLIVFYLFEIVSATYNCSDGSALIEDTGEINRYEKRGVNGIGIGIIHSDETPALRKYSATLLTNAQAFLLTEKDLSTTFVIDEASKKLTLINASETSATIKLDSSSDSFDEKQLKSIGSLSLLLADSSGVYPNGSATVKGIIGEKSVELTNSVPSIIMTINGKDYLLSLFSASDNNAIITVGTCTNATIVEIPEVAVTVSADSPNSSNINYSVNTSMNVSENITQEKINATINSSEILPSNTTEIISASTKPASRYIVLIIIALVSFCIIFTLYFLIHRFRKRREPDVE